MNTAHPLHGIRVLDLTNVLAGPFCGHQLAHLGARVIKLERPGRGDLARQLGADGVLNQRNMGVSFLAQNAGKLSVTLNLKHPLGKALLGRLVAGADVLVENFRPGVMQRLGVDYAALRTHNPRLVYCAISGFGQDGPMSALPAYDQIVQGLSGVMSITGSPEGDPTRAGFPVCDAVGGLTAAMAIGAALNARPRGGLIDVSMMEATLTTLGWVVSNFLNAGVAPERMGNENFTSAPSGAFAARDGLLNIAANEERQFSALCTVLGRADLRDNPDFADRELRKRHRAALGREIEKTLAARPASDWAADLNAVGVPAAVVNSVPEALSSDQVASRGLIAEFADVPGAGRDVRVLRPGFKIDGAAPAVNDPPPRLGEHNHRVYGELGLSREEIETYARLGVI